MGSTSAGRVQKYRKTLRAHGLRPIQLWVPDYRKAGFKDECRRQSLLLGNDESEIRELAWGEEIADRTGWV